MEALLAAELPSGGGWQYEPKWDGFRCLASRDGGAVELTSKSGKPLGRYFPEIVAMLEALKEQRFLLDGELIIPLGDALSFEALQLRLHPAESRIRKLSQQTPAEFMLFDLLALGGEPVAEWPLAERRKALERFHAAQRVHGLLLSPATQEHATALGWLDRSGGALDGVIAKRTTRNTAPASGRWSRSSSSAPRTASSAASAMPKRNARSVRCCSACSTTTACSTTSASRRRSRRRTAPR